MTTRFTGKILVTKRYKGVEGPTRPHEVRHGKEVRVKQGREIKAASRWDLQGMKLLPKSPLDSSPLGRGTGRGSTYFEESPIRSQSCALKESREEEAREREREMDRKSPMHLSMQQNGYLNQNHPNPDPIETHPLPS